MRFIAAIASLLVPFASACDALPQRPKTDFSGEQALAYAKAQVDFGPRVPGTPAHEKAADWIVTQMRTRADSVVVQSWTYTTVDGHALPMRNVLARFRPTEKNRVLYVTHWDTRPFADQDPNLGKRAESFDGANDGASGVGLLVAIADVLKKTPPSVGVDLLFVDGEDWGSFDNYSDTAASPQVLIGSTYFSRHLPEANYKPMFGVLFDMIGDKDLDIQEDITSLNAAPEVVQRVWQTAVDLGYAKYFQPRQAGPYIDDHVPLIKAGIRIIDVLDYDFESGGPGPDQTNYHHTSMDTMDKISAKSLQVVGDVALKLLQQ